MARAAWTPVKQNEGYARSSNAKNTTSITMHWQLDGVILQRARHPTATRDLCLQLGRASRVARKCLSVRCTVRSPAAASRCSSQARPWPCIGAMQQRWCHGPWELCIMGVICHAASALQDVRVHMQQRWGAVCIQVKNIAMQ